jgi:hypothetical protein
LNGAEVATSEKRVSSMKENLENLQRNLKELLDANEGQKKVD